MKVLVAAKLTQGQREDDFCYVSEGEMVTFSSECSREQIAKHFAKTQELLSVDGSKPAVLHIQTGRLPVQEISLIGNPVLETESESARALPCNKRTALSRCFPCGAQPGKPACRLLIHY